MMESANTVDGKGQKWEMLDAVSAGDAEEWREGLHGEDQG